MQRKQRKKKEINTDWTDKIHKNLYYEAEEVSKRIGFKKRIK